MWQKIGNLDWLFFSPKVLAVGIVVPWKGNANHIQVYFLLISNVLLFKNNKFETTSKDPVNKYYDIFILTCLFVNDSHATNVGFLNQCYINTFLSQHFPICSS